MARKRKSRARIGWTGAILVVDAVFINFSKIVRIVRLSPSYVIKKNFTMKTLTSSRLTTVDTVILQLTTDPAMLFNKIYNLLLVTFWGHWQLSKYHNHKGIKDPSLLSLFLNVYCYLLLSYMLESSKLKFPV